jgi:hypothetical protein
MEVLFVFLKWVASFAHKDAETGSKMDLGNLATVICPSILSARGKDAVRDETFSGLRVIQSLLENQDTFFTVPEGFLPLLHDQEYFVNSMELPSKEFMKKCDTYMRLKSGRPMPSTPYLGNGQMRHPPSFPPNSPPPSFAAPPDRPPRIPQNESYPSSPNMGQSQGMMQAMQRNPPAMEDWNSPPPPPPPPRPNSSSRPSSRPSSFVGPRSLPDSNQLLQAQGSQFNPAVNGYPSSAGRQRL